MTNIDIEKKYYYENPRALEKAKVFLLELYGEQGYEEIKIFSETFTVSRRKPKKRKENSEWVQYKELVWKLTKSRDLQSLPNFDKRGWKNYHLDHIFPIFQCFKLGVSAEICSDIRNLRFIPYKENLQKGVKITIELFLNNSDDFL